MKKLYFTRHGETIWNVENKICGATDIELTEEGHCQAKRLGRIIAKQNTNIDEILCSPLIRAMETARHISEITGIPMRVEPRLTEQNFGKYEGTARNGEEFLEAKSHFTDSFDGGESMMKVAQRIYNLVDDIKADDKTYLLVAHNGIARVIKSYFEDMSNGDFAKFGLKNCEVAVFNLYLDIKSLFMVCTDSI